MAAWLRACSACKLRPMTLAAKQLGFGFRVVAAKRADRGLSRGNWVAVGAGKKQRDEVAENGFQESGENGGVLHAERP